MAARYWVGGTGNWDAADTTHWSASSGGAGGASVPGASDDVTFDGSSGGGTVTVTASVDVLSITGGAHTGTLNTNGQTINTGTFNWSGTGTRTLTLGASAINITSGSGGNVLNFSTVTNMTLTANTSTITLSGANAFANIGSITGVNNLVFTGGGTGGLSGGAITFANLTWTGSAAKTDNFRIDNANQTITGTLTINGNSSVNRVLVRTNTLGTARTLTAANVSISNADFRDITAAGAANWDLSAITGLSGDCGGNSGITFTTAATQTYTGGTDNWSTAGKWTSRVPLPQDDVSMSGVTGGTITADMPRLGKSIDWTGASGSPTWTGFSSATYYGSLTMISGMTFTQNSSITIEARTSVTLTSAGKSFANTYNIFCIGGTLTLQDAFTNAGGTTLLQNGTFNLNNFNVSSTTMTDSGSATRSFVLTSSTISLTRTTTGSAWTATSTGMTLSAGTSTIYITDTGGNAKTFAGGGLTYNDLKISGGGAGAIIITGANTFNRIYTDGGGTKTLTFPASATTTLTYTGTDNFGNGNNLLTIASSSGGSAFTISKPVGRFEGDYLNLTDSTATGTFYAGEHSVNVSGNSGWIFSAFSPNQSGGLTMWLDALDGGDGTFTDRLNKTAYTSTSVTRGANINDGTEMIFNGTSSKIECGNIGEIYSVTFWVKPGTNACSLIDFNGTEYISTVSGTVTATSWTSPTIYVNGVVTSVLPTGVWSHVAVTSSTSVTASAVILGLIGSTYGDCSLTNIKMYDRVLSANEIGRQVPSFPSANRALLQDLVDYTGLTFYKNYGLPNINSVNADYASGSATGTWTVTRGTTTPATYCDADGTIQLVTGTNPRFTQGFYDSTGFVSRPGLIVEGASTNLYTRAVVDTTSSWNGASPNVLQYASGAANVFDCRYSGTGASTNSISTDSTYSRSAKISITNAGTAASDVRLVDSAGLSVTSGQVYTTSYFIKTSTSKTIPIATLDAATGTTNRGLDTTFTTVANTWIRVQLTWTANATDSIVHRIQLGNLGLYDFYIESRQFENLPFASTFIPNTTASTLTRNAETLSYATASNRTASTESVFIKGHLPGYDPALNRRLIQTATKRRSIRTRTTGFYLDAYANQDDSSSTDALSTTTLSANTSFVAAQVVSHNSPYITLYVNNVAAPDTGPVDYTDPAWGTVFYVGSDGASAGSFITIESLAIFSDAKSAASVASITDLLEAL